MTEVRGLEGVQEDSLVRKIQASSKIQVLKNNNNKKKRERETDKTSILQNSKRKKKCLKALNLWHLFTAVVGN